MEESFHSREPSYSTLDQPRETSNQRLQSQESTPPPAQEAQPPSPRKSMFEFHSPFDALAAPGPSSAKKKPSPPQPTGSSSGNDESWTSVSMSSDPKRKSVENLMDHLTRGPASHPSLQNPSISYDHYTSAEELSQAESGQSRGPGVIQPPVLLPKLNIADQSRSSPPKPQIIRQQARSGDSPVQSGQPANLQSSNRREMKDSVPTQPSRVNNWRGGKGGPGQKKNNETSPTCVLPICGGCR